MTKRAGDPIRRIRAILDRSGEGMAWSRPDRQRAALATAGSAAALTVATGLVAILESPAFGLTDASPIYFAAVVLVGSLLGPWVAIATAIGAFVVYDLLFTEPRLTLLVEDPREWLDLVLFLIIAIVVGRLAALGTERAEEASRRAAEATGLFSVGRILAIAPDVETGAPLVAERLVAATGLPRIWIVAEHRRGGARILADTGAPAPIPVSAFVTHLVRMPGDTPAVWQRAHDPAPGPTAASPSRGPRLPLLRVRMEADGVVVGTIKAVGRPGVAQPDRSATRLLALAADQLGLAIRRDDLRREATEVEIARQADALKSALLDAVSHDLRTPLANIRAQAGGLIDPDLPLDLATARNAGAAIDAEAQRLDRLVREVLDLSRVESGALRPDLEAIDAGEAVRSVVDRLRPLLGERAIDVALADDLPPVRADAVLLDGLLTNLVENVARHAPPPAPLRVTAAVDNDRVELTIDDGGPGVPAGSLGRLFERFDRVPASGEGSRRGLGLGLSIVRGFAEVMGASVRAEPSPLGGLRMIVSLPAAAALASHVPA
jgi:two-component system, OmpR family, sensor histidine kinase KdpD